MTKVLLMVRHLQLLIGFFYKIVGRICYSVDMAVTEEALVESIAAEIRGEIARSGSNVKETARRLDRDYWTIRKYLRGERDIPLKVFLELCSLLDQDPAEIVRRASARVHEVN